MIFVLRRLMTFLLCPFCFLVCLGQEHSILIVRLLIISKKTSTGLFKSHVEYWSLPMKLRDSALEQNPNPQGHYPMVGTLRYCEGIYTSHSQAMNLAGLCIMGRALGLWWGSFEVLLGLLQPSLKPAVPLGSLQMICKTVAAQYEKSVSCNP
ncbi:hypothetical protein BY996DRAFT_6428511 [Phakopsora pachyrhizi]|nr:hypothetical protein BY996DRAFT_6428657 [Phakopsora pachyrhizi]KAI8442936.1 hypothetical protein BY996DRAFT_6428511 [Phakopsora pachyrhizi]